LPTACGSLSIRTRIPEASFCPFLILCIPRPEPPFERRSKLILVLTFASNSCEMGSLDLVFIARLHLVRAQCYVAVPGKSNASYTPYTPPERFLLGTRNSPKHLCANRLRKTTLNGSSLARFNHALNPATLQSWALTILNMDLPLPRISILTKKADDCPLRTAQSRAAYLNLNPSSTQVQELFRVLIQHHVAVTSILPVSEAYTSDRPRLQQRVLDVMSPQAQSGYLAQRVEQESGDVGLNKEMELERAFVRAGGFLLAGPDPTGIGGVVAGFGDQREVELLVEAGFTPLEAIQIATSNGAQFLGEAEHIGTLAPGKQADLVVIHGDPSSNINDIENVEIVFKDGVGYDSAKLIESVCGQVGFR